MRAVSVVGGVTFIRPLLRMTRGEIELFLTQNGISTWAKDSSNASDLFLRNYLRNTLLPGLESRFPGALKGMERSLNALEADADFIEDCVAAIPPENKKSIAFWQKQHDAVKIRLLRELTGVIPTRDLLEQLNKALVRTTPELRKLPVTQEKVIFLRNDLIEMGCLQHERPAPFLWEWRTTPACYWGNWHFAVSRGTGKEVCGLDTALFDGDLLPDVLEIDFPVPGERMQVFGSHSLQKIKKLRNDRHIGVEKKFPLLRGEQGVFWAPLIRHGALAAVTETTENIVKFEIKGIEST
jgi:tRNA(Ile)-lysidine synthase